MRWDDLLILRRVDEFETAEPGSLFTGYSLSERLREGTVLQPNDYTSFARELLLARGRGYLTFQDMVVGGGEVVDPEKNAHLWLQRIQNIRLTLEGRDRARARVFIGEVPDPQEDDGRAISSLTLQAIGRDMGTTYSGAQLSVFLQECDVPAEYLAVASQESKTEFIASVLEPLLSDGSEARRFLRTFLGTWLSDGYVTGPTSAEAAQEIKRLLARQGWVVKGSRLVVGTPDPELLARPPVKSGRRFEALHPAVREGAARWLQDEQYEVAAFEAFKAVARRVKTLSGLPTDGTDLMAKAFGGDHPVLPVADLTTHVGRDRQVGYRFLFMGAAMAIRNPDAHDAFPHLSDDEAFERLSLASLLMRCLDEVALRQQNEGLESTDE